MHLEAFSVERAQAVCCERLTIEACAGETQRPRGVGAEHWYLHA